MSKAAVRPSAKQLKSLDITALQYDILTLLVREHRELSPRKVAEHLEVSVSAICRQADNMSAKHIAHWEDGRIKLTEGGRALVISGMALVARRELH